MTTPEQSEALRLAAEFERAWVDVEPCAQAAAELRRLSAENAALTDSNAAKADRIDRLGETVERLTAENAELRKDAEHKDAYAEQLGRELARADAEARGLREWLETAVQAALRLERNLHDTAELVQRAEAAIDAMKGLSNDH